MATVIERVLAQIDKSKTYGHLSVEIAAWVASGEVADMHKVTASKGYAWLEMETIALIAGDDSPQCQRLLAVCLRRSDVEAVCHWMRRRLATPERVLGLLNQLLDWNIGAIAWNALLRSSEFLAIVYPSGQLSFVGQWLHSKGAPILEHLPVTQQTIDLVLEGGVGRCVTWLNSAIARDENDWTLPAMIAYAIRRGGSEFVALGNARRESTVAHFQKFVISSAMAEVDAKWNSVAVADAWQLITQPSKLEVEASQRKFHGEEPPEIASAWLARNDPNYAARFTEILYKRDFDEGAGADGNLDSWFSLVVGPGIAKLGTSADELWYHLARTAAHQVRVLAFKQLLRSAESKRTNDLARILRGLIELHAAAAADSKLLTGPKVLGHGTRSYQGSSIRGEVIHRLIELLTLVTKPVATLLLDCLVSLFTHPEVAVRKAAMAAALRAEGDVVGQIAAILNEGGKDARVVAALALATIGTPAALSKMEARLSLESSEEVRAVMYGGLDRAWQSSGRLFSDKELEARVVRVERQLAKPLASWVNPKELPRVAKRGGGSLPESWVSFLLWRQSMHNEISVDPEARPIWDMIDRSKAADFGVTVLEQFMASKQDAKDRWALAIGGLLGDDRTVLTYRAAIDSWVAKSRGAMAEHAATAMALVNSDAALAMVDDVANTYRFKHKNIGAAANAAFEAAALARGMTPDELGDAVVPWLAFKPGVPLSVDVKGEAVGVRVGPDGKLVFRVGGKDKTSLPTGASAPVKEQIKTLAADLRGLMKAQVRRHSRMLVQQRRWPAAAWAKLYLSHPLLVPFLTQLIWAEYDTSGGITKLFRGLPDGTLTDVEDGKVPTPTKNHIGLVHPLELDEATRAAWRTHLSDYEVVPPVPQLDRASVRVQPDQQSQRTYSAAMGTSLNALTFKGRAERLGWRRGAVVDGGCVNVYLKQFHAAGVDVVLGIDGMFMGVGVDDSISLREAWFVKGGSVNTGGYTYDEPSNGDDPRVMAFGDVPSIVYSETMAELAAIAGKAADEDD